MRNIVISFIIACMSCLPSVADVLDQPSRHLLASLRSPRGKRMLAKAGETTIYYPTILKLKADQTIESLEAEGVIIMRQRDNLVLAFVPTDKIEQLQTNSGVQRMNVNSRSIKSMDKARPIAGVDRIIEPGVEFANPWTASGVVVGMTDIGFDPHHPNFIAPDGSMRVKRIVNYQDTLAVVNRLYEPSAIADWRTDDDDEWHGTHVMGILAGSHRDTPYYGIAQDADIVATTSILTDACLLDGIEEIIDYARSQGKPAVVNMSVGSYLGPRDGTTLFNQYLDKLGQEAIICMSAGNEAISTNCIQADFTSDFTSSKVFVTDRHHYDAVHECGGVDLWSADDKTFSVGLAIYDLATYKIIAEYPLQGSTPGFWEIASPGYGDEGAVSDPVFDNCYNGYFRVSSGIDPENGRYRVYVTMDMKCRDQIGPVGRYFVTLTISGNPGTHVDAYADGYNVYFTNGGRGDFFRPNADMSISDIACSHNVIVVGASSSRASVPQLGGEDLRFDFQEGCVADFSSYGRLADGRVLPHITAPGNYIVSSVSTPFIEAHPDVIPYMSAETTHDGRRAWYIAECGTSMSAPYFAGVVATWLQADPTLDVKTIRDIAQRTATNTAPDADNPRWGGGALDAVAGMREVLKHSGVYLPTIGNSMETAVSVRGGCIAITHPSSAEFTATLYNMAGTAVDKYHGSDYALDIPTHGLPKGVYLLTITSRSASTTHKVAIR